MSAESYVIKLNKIQREDEQKRKQAANKHHNFYYGFVPSAPTSTLQEPPRNFTIIYPRL